MDDPIKQHYIPSFHLSLFSMGDQKGSDIWVTDLKYKKQYLRTASKMAYMSDLYTFEPGSDIEDRYILEKTFSQIERETAKTFRKILDTERLPSRNTHSTSFDILINYIALLAVRTPQKIESMVNPIIKTQEIVLDIITSDPKKWEATQRRIASTKNEKSAEMVNISFDEARNIKDKIKLKVAQNYKMKMMLDAVDILIPLLAKRYWTLYLSKDDTTTMPQLGGFICSDNPVSIISLRKLPAIYSPGFGMPYTEVSIPISKNAFLVGRFNGSDTTEVISIRGMASANSRTSMYADRYLFHANKNHIFVDNNDEIQNVTKLLNVLKNS